MRKATRSDQGAPNRPIGAATAAPSSMPINVATDCRELAVTRLIASGRTRGMPAERATAYARVAMRQSKARGSNQGDPSATTPASTHERKARRASVVPIAQRRPCRQRSSRGPTRGARTTNGAIVVTRNSATWPRAWPRGRARIVLASATVKAASPAEARTCISVTRLRPDSAAPSDRANSRNRSVPAFAPRPMNLAPTTTPLAVALLAPAVARPAALPARAVARPVTAAARRARSLATSTSAGWSVASLRSGCRGWGSPAAPEPAPGPAAAPKRLPGSAPASRIAGSPVSTPPSCRVDADRAARHTGESPRAARHTGDSPRATRGPGVMPHLCPAFSQLCDCPRSPLGGRFAGKWPLSSAETSCIDRTAATAVTPAREKPSTERTPHHAR